jgi:energy-coupling factor transport system substrate-specific component
MREIVTMWSNTRMVVLTALTAALYAAVLIPFKIATIVPGFTEVRPGVVVPLVFGLLFGPAAAWGAGIGNLIGDVLGGTFGLGSIPGFVGNFLFALTPYKLLGPPPTGAALTGDATWKTTGRFVAAALPASAVCAATIAWGVDLLGFVPFAVLGPVIFLNNLVVGIVLGPVLLRLLLPRVAAWHLLWSDVMPPSLPRPERVRLGRVLLWAGAVGMLLVGLAAAWGLGGPLIAGTGVLPFLLLFLVGAFIA